MRVFSSNFRWAHEDSAEAGIVEVGHWLEHTFRFNPRQPRSIRFNRFQRRSDTYEDQIGWKSSASRTLMNWNG